MELETLLCSPCFPIKTQSCAAGDALTFIFGNRKNSKGGRQPARLSEPED